MLKGWCSLRSGARKLLEKYLIVACTEKSDQILCERLLPFWSLQKRRKLYSYSTFLAEEGSQEDNPCGDICIQKCKRLCSSKL